jgi:hypothetical protein
VIVEIEIITWFVVGRITQEENIGVLRDDVITLGGKLVGITN